MDTAEELKQKIQKETELIVELEKSCPATNPNSTEWYIHQTKIRDAYWRRRMLTTRLEGGDLNATAEVY